MHWAPATNHNCSKEPSRASTGKWEHTKCAAQLQRRFWDSKKGFPRKQKTFPFKTYNKSTPQSKDDEAWPWSKNREQPFFTLNSLYLCKLHIPYLLYQQRALAHCQLTDTSVLGLPSLVKYQLSTDLPALISEPRGKEDKPTFQATPGFAELPYEMPVSQSQLLRKSHQPRQVTWTSSLHGNGVSDNGCSQRTRGSLVGREENRACVPREYWREVSDDTTHPGLTEHCLHNLP